jgi:hypothetical protein
MLDSLLSFGGGFERRVRAYLPVQIGGISPQFLEGFFRHINVKFLVVDLFFSLYEGHGEISFCD